MCDVFHCLPIADKKATAKFDNLKECFNGITVIYWSLIA